MGRQGSETHRRALERLRRRVVDLSASGIIVQGIRTGSYGDGCRGPPHCLRSRLRAPTAWSADFEKGKAAFERDEYSFALSEFLPLAEQGHFGAQFYLGRMYGVGLGVPQDYARAAQWYRKAADQGHDRGPRCNLGVMYRQRPRACRRTTLSPLSGFAKPPTRASPRPNFTLGSHVPQRRGRTAGSRSRRAVVPQGRRPGPRPGPKPLGISVPRRRVPHDYAQPAVVSRYRPGPHLAQFNLGFMYHAASAYRKDHALTAQWFPRAADQGYATIQPWDSCT